MPITVEAEAPEDTIARIAAVRYEHEVAGIARDTRYISTDRTSQSKLHAARTKGLEGIAPAAGWKCADANGNIVWWACTASEIVAAADAAFDYVDACFVREKELAQSVADGTFTEADLELGWP